MTKTTAGAPEWIALFAPLAAIGIGVLIYAETRPMDVTLDAQRLHVDGGFYDFDIPITRIRDIELRDSRPPDAKRLNGFASGWTKRGYFDVAGIGRARVFTDSATGPYLLIRTDDGPILLGLGNAAATKRLRASLLIELQHPRQ